MRRSLTTLYPITSPQILLSHFSSRASGQFNFFHEATYTFWWRSQAVVDMPIQFRNWFWAIDGFHLGSEFSTSHKELPVNSQKSLKTYVYTSPGLNFNQENKNDTLQHVVQNFSLDKATLRYDVVNSLSTYPGNNLTPLFSEKFWMLDSATNKWKLSFKFSVPEHLKFSVC